MMCSLEFWKGQSWQLTSCKATKYWNLVKTTLNGDYRGHGYLIFLIWPS